MKAKDWLKKYKWHESDFNCKGDLKAIAVTMDLFANYRILEALKIHDIENPYCFCEIPSPALNNKTKCVKEGCERRINKKNERKT